MKIVIAGAGEVGTHLAKMLSNEEQDIIIMDTDNRKLAALDSYNLLTYCGSATSFSGMKDVRVGSADIFIGVTPFEARNILACQIAKSMGARKTVARIANAEYLSRRWQAFFAERGVDDLIYPEYLAAREMITSMKHTWVRNWFELFDGELILVGVKLRGNAKIVGHQLKDIGSISSYMHISAIKRNNETIIPRGYDRVLDGDIVYIATTKQHIDQVVDLCGKMSSPAKKVFIMGGGEITAQLVKQIDNPDRVKIVEPDLERCHELNNLLPGVRVVNGDARDIDLLEEESLSDYDVFVALSDSSETNILGCLIAKEHGLAKTIAQVENLQYVNEAEALNIGTIINKKLLASSRIFQIMLDNDVENARCLALADAEVAELVVKPKSKVTRADVRDLSLPDSMTIAGLVRDGVGQLVGGQTRLQAGDHVVVFCLSGSIHKIEKAFG